MALDQGTTSSRTILFDESGKIVAEANAVLDCHFPQSGWVEQVPEDIWVSQRQTIEAALEQAKLTMKDISAVGITNQRESTIAWNRETGEALGPAINWQCRRTADFCEELKAEGFASLLRERTGLVTDPYFSGTKMRWILEKVPQARQMADQGELCFGTVDSWLIWKLTGGRVHATEISNASRTLVFNIEACEWDAEILMRFGIPQETLPEVKPSSGVIATVNAELFGGEAPIAGVAGDQQAALFGQQCTHHGMVKNTYGTGCFMLMHTGNTPSPSHSRLLTTVAWQIEGQPVEYALEGSVFIAGAAIQWLRDGLQIIDQAEQVNDLAESVSDSGGVMLVPAFTGWGTPHWDPQARGVLVGLTRDSNRGHIARAALEGIALSVATLVELAEAALGTSLGELAVDGGAAASAPLLQAQADCTGLTVRRPANLESTARGVALFAGLQAGAIRSFDDLAAARRNKAQLFEPQMNNNQRSSWRNRWNDAVSRSLGWHG